MSAEKSGYGRYTTIAAGLAAVAVATAFSGKDRDPPCHYGATTPKMKRVEKLLEAKVRTGSVDYDANKAVICNQQETAIPVVDKANAPKAWFRLTGTMPHIKVEQIVNPTLTREQLWSDSNADKRQAINQHGPVTPAVDGTPLVTIHLSNGEDLQGGRALGQTARLR